MTGGLLMQGHQPLGKSGLALAAGLTLLLMGAGFTPCRAQQDPPPPEPRLKEYHPDETTCQGPLIRSSFAKNLLPWAEQPPQVFASLRQVQVDMTQATLASCVRQKLMTPAQAEALQKELGLITPPNPQNPPQTSTPSSGAPTRP